MYVWLQRRQDNLYIQVFATLRQDSSTPKPRQDTSMKPRQDTSMKPRQDISMKPRQDAFMKKKKSYDFYHIGFFFFISW